MSEQRDVFTRAVAELGGDAESARIMGPSEAVLIFGGCGERLLWASAKAAPMHAALTNDQAGEVEESVPAVSRLRALAGGLAPTTSFRLERLQFDPARLAAPITCACRRIVLSSGEEVLAVVIVGPVSRLAPLSRQSRDLRHAPETPQERSADHAQIAAEAARSPEERSPVESPKTLKRAGDPVAYLRPRGKVRFVWQADAEGRFTDVSDLLTGIVGTERAQVVGRTWRDIIGPDVDDPSGRVGEAFLRRETWSGEIVYWRIRDTDFFIPVEFAGAPIFDRNGALQGFRGFGLFRTGDIVERQRPGTLIRKGAAARSEKMEDGSGPIRGEHAPAEGDRAAQLDRDKPPLEGEQKHERVAVPPSFSPLRGSVRGCFGDSRPPLRSAKGAGASDALTPSRASANERHAERTEPAGAVQEPGGAPLSRLSLAERSAFREIARALGARFEGDEAAEAPAPAETEGQSERTRTSTVTPIRPAPATDNAPLAIIDRLPIALFVHRRGAVMFANRHFLDLAGYKTLEELRRHEGVAGLFPAGLDPVPHGGLGAPVTLVSRQKGSLAVEVRTATIDWEGAPAVLILVRQARETEAHQRLLATELNLQDKEARLCELSAILDTATDGVLTLDNDGRILSLNRSGEALFGYEENEVAGDTFLVLLAPESHALARDYFEGLRLNGVASVLNDGREIMGRVRQGGSIPLFMTICPVREEPERKFCAVLRDITAFKRTETELGAAQRAADEASAQKSDFLARVGHEIRSPLSAIVGFAEVMLEERFGPLGSERYKDYVRDIHGSGGQIVKLVDDLLDLAKIEAGRMELAFTGVNLNERVAECVVQWQAQAARQRIVIRTSFAPKLPLVVADERSIRQILSNIVSNAIKFTNAGGQVIVSTAMADQGEVAIRVRDTGVGMSDDEIRAALGVLTEKPGGRPGGAGLGLPLTKALVEANRGVLHITSARDAGTLLEVVFPPTRVLAE